MTDHININYPHTEDSTHMVQAAGRRKVAYFAHRADADLYAGWLRGINYTALVSEV